MEPCVSQSQQKLVMNEIAACQPRLRAFVRCLLVHASDVDDVLQEVNSVLWEKAEQFEPGTSFWAWASQIARFKVLNAVSRYARERVIFDQDTISQMAQVIEERVSTLDDRRRALESCLARLPSSQRQLIELRYTDGQAIDRISQSIGRPVGSIRQTLYRIRGVLLECIQRQLHGQEHPA